MTFPVLRTRSYEEDLHRIWSYIADRSPQAADRIVRRIESRVDGLREFPNVGETQPQFGANCRRVIVGNYLVFYLAHDDRVEVLRVLHGARRIEDLDHK